MFLSLLVQCVNFTRFIKFLSGVRQSVDTGRVFLFISDELGIHLSVKGKTEENAVLYFKNYYETTCFSEAL